MSYTPTNWQKGDAITAEKLNKLENGVASGGSKGASILIAEETKTSDGGTVTYTLDKTWNEIHECLANGGLCYVRAPYKGDPYEVYRFVYKATTKSDSYVIGSVLINGATLSPDYKCSNPDDYPTATTQSMG